MFRLGDKMDKTRAVTVNPIFLAFVGDAVYSLFVREKLVFESDYKTGDLNKMATAEVKAKSQAEFAIKLMSYFTEEELNVYKRARNSKKPTKAKSASVSEYNMATGFEAVLGYLYLVGDVERINFLLNVR